MNYFPIFRVVLFGLLVLNAGAAAAKEYHVATTGDDSNSGKRSAPLRSIQKAADLAQPGDVITVHAGIYRERINPPRGGVSEKKRIIYQAAKGEKVEIRGSEVVKNWRKVQDNVWKVAIPNSFFGKFNPYSDLIRGDWFDGRGREHHTGAVYLNGSWLTEAAQLEEVMAATSPNWLAEAGKRYKELNRQLWFAKVDSEQTTIWAQFNGVDPNEQLVEINVRQTIFYPNQPGRNFITVRGFVMRHAATPWAPPTAEQIGLIGTHWSKGWIIENNTISHSVCSGVALGKYGDQWDNTSANSAEGYVKTIERALQNGWNKATVGGHVVRNNTISHCEQTAIVGSLGAAFSRVTGNVIHDIHVRALFSGAEMAGIKFHAAIDTVIERNHIYRTCRGLWLDWMAQGTRVSRNLFHENASEDLFVEVDHGPFIVDNNLFLSRVSLLDMSEGGAYLHNLFTGKIVSRPEPGRETPYHPAHTTKVAGLTTIKGGDDRFYNNIFVGNGETPVVSKDPEWNGGYGLWVYHFREYPLQIGGNVYYKAAQAYRQETSAFAAAKDPGVRLSDSEGRFTLQLSLGPELHEAKTSLVTTEVLGLSKVARLAYENPDGSSLRIASDYAGKRRKQSSPTPGPFENPGNGDLRLKVW